jgi:putative two-component system response regulator
MSSTILIVDDESAGRDTLEAILEGQGYTLEMAENGQQAIEKARNLLPDVILLDVMMPGMTGFEVCKSLRDDPSLAEIPIIIVTALDDHESLMQGLGLGADDFITKPFDRIELRARLYGITQLNRFRKLVEERSRVESARNELSAAYDSTIKGWSRSMEMRDRETEGHTERVTEITLQLAREMGLPEAELVHVQRGAMLHDMGKLSIPDSILLKPKTTDEEWKVMRQHPQLAYDMLNLVGISAAGTGYPLCHHEKWDGNGLSTKGSEIPLMATPSRWLMCGCVSVQPPLPQSDDREVAQSIWWRKPETLRSAGESVLEMLDRDDAIPL